MSKVTESLGINKTLVQIGHSCGLLHMEGYGETWSSKS